MVSRDWMDIHDAVAMELAYARQIHKPMHSAHEGISVIREEFEELWEHVKNDTAQTPEARKEAIQLAAMALAFIKEVCDAKV